MADSDITSALSRLLYFYNGEGYDAASNPGGLDDDGHTENFVPALQDVATAAKYAATMATNASQYADAGGGWTAITGAVFSYISGTVFTVTGDHRVAFEQGRAIFVTQNSSGYGYVGAASYDSGTGLTTVIVTGIILDAGLLSVKLGQAIENAPQSPFVATMFIVNNYVTP